MVEGWAALVWRCVAVRRVAVGKGVVGDDGVVGEGEGDGVPESIVRAYISYK